MNSTTTVAVVIAAFNAERTIVAALRSVIEQTRPVDQLVVVDDGSTDATARLADSLGSPVVIRLTANEGVAAALNHGIAATTADIVMFLDADDLWSPHKVAVQLKLFDAEPDLDLMFGLTAQFHDDADQPISTASNAAEASLDPIVGIHKSTMAIRRVALDNVGVFDSAFDRADLIEWLARPAVGRLRRGFVDDVVHFRRLHADNMGRRHADEQRRQYAEVMRSLSRRRRSETVSAIIPVFNGADHLEASLQSVLGQTRAVDQIVIVDDASSDDSALLASRLCPSATIIVHPVNRGVAAARNTGLAASTGDWIAFCDHDDLWPEQRTEMLLRGRLGSTEWITGRTHLFATHGGVIDQRAAVAHDTHLPLLLSSSLIRSVALQRLGGLDETWVSSDDVDLWLRFCESGAVATRIDEVTLLHRVMAGTLTKRQGSSVTKETFDVIRASARRRRSDRQPG